MRVSFNQIIEIVVSLVSHVISNEVFAPVSMSRTHAHRQTAPTHPWCQISSLATRVRNNRRYACGGSRGEPWRRGAPNPASPAHGNRGNNSPSVSRTCWVAGKRNKCISRGSALASTAGPQGRGCRRWTHPRTRAHTLRLHTRHDKVIQLERESRWLHSHFRSFIRWPQTIKRRSGSKDNTA